MPAVLGLLSSRQHFPIHGVRITIDELLHLGSLIHSYYHRSRLADITSRGPGAVIIVGDVADSDKNEFTDIANLLYPDSPA